MTDMALPIAPLAEPDFRLGNVFNRTISVLSRNFLPFFVVTTAASLPDVLLSDVPMLARRAGIVATALPLLGQLLAFVLGAFGQAIVAHAAFQDMRGRPVSLAESVRFGMSRFLPLIGLSVSVMALTMASFVLLIVPGFIVMTMLSVATPVCVVEQLGPFRSMERSARLTKGHRWAILGAMAVLQFLTAIPSGLMESVMSAVAGPTVALAGNLIGNGVAGTIVAVFTFVMYHDLRVIKDGVDTDQIANVFA
jgi:hypothetical protein